MSLIEYRFESVIRQMAPSLTWDPVAHMPLVFIGTAYARKEIHQFHDLLTRARTHVAILMTPSGILGNIDLPGWTQRYWDDFYLYGDVLGGYWDVLLNTNSLKTAKGASGFRMGNTIADKYLRLGQTAAADPD